MRAKLLTVAALTFGLAVVAAPDAKAYPVYPWCSDISGFNGATNCYFSTWDQCRQAASGNGGICYQNPFYGASGYGGADVRPRRRARGS